MLSSEKYTPLKNEVTKYIAGFSSSQTAQIHVRIDPHKTVLREPIV